MLGDALLTKVTTTSGGAIYGDGTVSSPLGISGVMVEPAGGSAGQVIKKTENGYEWASLEQVSIDIDDTLDSSSVNPVQNKAVWSALDGKAAASHSHAQADITGLAAALGSKADSSQITALNNALGSKANTSHTHAQADITGLAAALGSKANTSHTHAQADVTGLAAALGSKADTSHTHAQADVTGLADALGSKANTSHTHAQADATGLAAALSSKANTSHTHAQADITGLADALGSKANTSHTHSAADVAGVVPETRQVNGNALSSNVTLTALDIPVSGSAGAETVSDALEALSSSIGEEWFTNEFEIVSSFGEMQSKFMIERYNIIARNASRQPSQYTQTELLYELYNSDTRYTYPKIFFLNNDTSGSGTHFYRATYIKADVMPAFNIHLVFNNDLDHHEENVTMTPAGMGYFVKENDSYTLVTPIKVSGDQFQIEQSALNYTIWGYDAVDGSQILYASIRETVSTGDNTYQYQWTSRSFRYNSQSGTYSPVNSWFDDPSDNTRPKVVFTADSSQPYPGNIFITQNRSTPYISSAQFAHFFNTIEITDATTANYDPQNEGLNYIDLTASHDVSISSIAGLQTLLSRFIQSPAGGSSGNILARTDSAFEWVEMPAAITVDADLSADSVNPVQNKVINSAIGLKADVSHTHAQADITGLSAALGSKANSSHTHAQADITGLAAAIGSKANASHTHAQADITGLSAALGSKADTSDITNINNALASKITMPTTGSTGTGYYLKKISASEVAIQAFDSNITSNSINAVRGSTIYAKTSAIEARISAVETQLSGIETLLSGI